MINKIGILTIIALFILVSIPIATALETELTIRTKRPDYGIIVRIVDPDDHDKTFDSVYGTTGSDGVGKITYSTTRLELAFLVILIKGEREELKIFEGPYTIQPKIELSFFDYEQETETAEEETNEIEEETGEETNETEDIAEAETELTEEAKEDGSIITGNVLGNSNENVGISNVAYYLIAAVSLAGLIGFFLLKRFSSTRRSKKRTEYSPPPTTEFTGATKPDNGENRPSGGENRPPGGTGVERDRKRIQNLKKEIKLIKKKERFREAEEKYEEANRELKRLDRGQQE